MLVIRLLFLISTLFVLNLSSGNVSAYLKVNHICEGSSTGSIEVLISMPYTYTWFDTGMSGSRTNLPKGIYVLEYIDGDGCKQFETIEIQEIGSCVVDINWDYEDECNARITVRVLNNGIPLHPSSFEVNWPGYSIFDGNHEIVVLVDQTRQYCVNIVMFNNLCCNPSSDCVTVLGKTGCNQEEFALLYNYLNIENPYLSILDLKVNNNPESGFLHLGVFGNGICKENISLSGSTINIELINDPPRTNQLYEIVFRNNEKWNDIAAGSVLKLSEANISNNNPKSSEVYQNDKYFLIYELDNNHAFRIRKVMNNGRKYNHHRLWEDMRLHVGHIRLTIKTSDGQIIESFTLPKDELNSTNFNSDLNKFDEGFKFNTSVLTFLRTCTHDPMKSKWDVNNALSSNNIFEVFPNPAFKEYSVRYKSTSTGLFTLDNYNALGELVNTTTWDGTMSGELRLDANETNSGLQILVLRFPDGQTTTQKLIIIK